jgi:hypothetical protein
MKWSPDQIDSVIKLVIGTTFCMVLLMMSSLAMYSVVFVTQPMNAIAPADKQFFMLLSDMSKYILGALATLLAIKGKDGVAKLIDPPPGVSKASDWTDPPKAPPPSPAQAPVRMEPTIAPIASAGYNGKAAPEQPPHPEIT